MRFSDSEWTVMQAVWDGAESEDAVTARDVHGAVVRETDWTYSTVRTLLTRLVGKGALTARKRGQKTEYVHEVGRDVARRSALRSLVERAFDGRVDALASHLADERSLSARERRTLKRLLEVDDGDAGEDGP